MSRDSEKVDARGEGWPPAQGRSVRLRSGAAGARRRSLAKKLPIARSIRSRDTPAVDRRDRSTRRVRAMKDFGSGSIRTRRTRAPIDRAFSSARVRIDRRPYGVRGEDLSGRGLAPRFRPPNRHRRSIAALHSRGRENFGRARPKRHSPSRARHPEVRPAFPSALRRPRASREHRLEASELRQNAKRSRTHARSDRHGRPHPQVARRSGHGRRRQEGAHRLLRQPVPRRREGPRPR